MLQKEVQVGSRYRAKISGRIVTVRITAKIERQHLRMTTTGWTAVNEQTGKTVVIKSAAKLRRAVTDAAHVMPVDSRGNPPSAAALNVRENRLHDEVTRLLRKGWDSDQIVDAIQADATFNAGMPYLREEIVDAIEYIANNTELPYVPDGQ